MVDSDDEEKKTDRIFQARLLLCAIALYLKRGLGKRRERERARKHKVDRQARGRAKRRPLKLKLGKFRRERGRQTQMLLSSIGHFSCSLTRSVTNHLHQAHVGFFVVTQRLNRIQIQEMPAAFSRFHFESPIEATSCAPVCIGRYPQLFRLTNDAGTLLTDLASSSSISSLLSLHLHITPAQGKDEQEGSTIYSQPSKLVQVSTKTPNRFRH